MNQTLGVSAQGTAITVSLDTEALGHVTSTKADIAAAVNGHPQASTMVTALITGPTVGAGLAEPMIDRYLQGGAGANTGDYSTFSTTATGGAALESLTVSRDGAIIGIFENGTTEELARVAVAMVPNRQGLLAIGGGKFAESPTSGSGLPVQGAGSGGTGSIASGFLEMSNVDLSQ